MKLGVMNGRRAGVDITLTVWANDWKNPTP